MMNQGTLLRSLMRVSAGLAAGACLLAVLAQPAQAQGDTLQISFSLPEIKTGQYQRPYTAVWVETSRGKAVKTLAVWHGDKKWLKDLRRWWRKTGRYQEGDIDGATGATRGPGDYQIVWDGTDSKGNSVVPGEYQLVLEASREHGSRSLMKQKFTLPDTDAHYRIKAGKELGAVEIAQP
ncbi:DUF2271 domain-containing protein [Oceanospirillum sp.]|uniref:DUF2271 domain-containing protein n=1 Tax=Oceanospirillum sp. TaxID=2021254 RepID=UPI003A915567